MLKGLTEELRVKRKALETKICEFNITQPTKRAKISEIKELVKTPKKGTVGNTKVQEFALSTSKRTKILLLRLPRRFQSLEQLLNLSFRSLHLRSLLEDLTLLEPTFKRNLN